MDDQRKHCLWISVLVADIDRELWQAEEFIRTDETEEMQPSKFGVAQPSRTVLVSRPTRGLAYERLGTDWRSRRAIDHNWTFLSSSRSRPSRGSRMCSEGHFSETRPLSRISGEKRTVILRLIWRISHHFSKLSARYRNIFHGKS
jgi:hypothetical protein